jgi:hypothetical protein
MPSAQTVGSIKSRELAEPPGEQPEIRFAAGDGRILGMRFASARLLRRARPLEVSNVELQPYSDSLAAFLEKDFAP